MENDEGVKGINWHIGIPVVLWIGITFLGILKVLLGSGSELEVSDIVVTVINTFNSCTFSTFISVIICILYQCFTTAEEKREEVCGLAMRRMPAIIILTVIYGGAAIFDAAISHIVMSIIFINCKYCIRNLFFQPVFGEKEKIERRETLCYKKLRRFSVRNTKRI